MITDKHHKDRHHEFGLTALDAVLYASINDRQRRLPAANSDEARSSVDMPVGNKIGKKVSVSSNYAACAPCKYSIRYLITHPPITRIIGDDQNRDDGIRSSRHIPASLDFPKEWKAPTGPFPGHAAQSQFQRRIMV